jgi:hypothetical protein
MAGGVSAADRARLAALEARLRALDSEMALMGKRGGAVGAGFWWGFAGVIGLLLVLW